MFIAGQKATLRNGKQRTIREVIPSGNERRPYAVRFHHDTIFYTYTIAGQHGIGCDSPADIMGIENESYPNINHTCGFGPYKSAGC